MALKPLKQCKLLFLFIYKKILVSKLQLKMVFQLYFLSIIYDCNKKLFMYLFVFMKSKED